MKLFLAAVNIDWPTVPGLRGACFYDLIFPLVYFDLRFARASTFRHQEGGGTFRGSGRLLLVLIRQNFCHTSVSQGMAAREGWRSPPTRSFVCRVINE